MLMVSRILVGLIGCLSALSVFQHWFNLDSLVADRGLRAIGDIGRANVRADVGGMFLGIALFSLIAAVKQSAGWLLAAMGLAGSALLGRVVSIALDGSSSRVISPILVEVVVIGIFLFAYQQWEKVPEGL